MTSTLIWVYITIVVTGSLGADFMVRTGMAMFGHQVEIYPSWLLECHYAYYYFSAVLAFLLDKFSSPFLSKNYMQDIQWMVDKVFIAHIVTVIPMRLLGVYWLAAYGGSLIVAVVIPVAFAWWYYPRWLKKQESEVINAESMVEIAKQSQVTQTFLEMFPAARIYVFDNKARNDRATCLFLMRRERIERDNLLEDVLLQIPIDLKQQAPIEKDARFLRYLFYEENGAASAFHLPEPTLDNPDSFDAPPDRFSLDKIDSAPSRHPSLKDAPLPIAAREVEFQIVYYQR